MKIFGTLLLNALLVIFVSTIGMVVLSALRVPSNVNFGFFVGSLTIGGIIRGIEIGKGMPRE